MAWQIKFESQAEKELFSLDNSVKIRILKYLRKLEGCDEPRVFGKPLTENLSGYWRYRIGNYRIISRIYDAELVILLLAIRKRDVVYRIRL
jgi:mRNA interferase RelE/StbE